MASTVLASKQAILALLQASPTLGGATPAIPVWWATPNWDHGAGQVLYLGAVRETQDWAQLGTQRRDENYTIDLEVRVYQGGTDAQSCETTLWTLVRAAETALASDVNLGNTVVAMHVESIDQSTQVDREGLLCSATVGINVHARI